MMPWIRRFSLCAALACPLLAAATPPADSSNLALRELMQQDQAPRAGNVNHIDWSVVSVQDAERRQKVGAIIRAGGLKTAEDYHNAALIFQHGSTVEDIRMAYSLATVATYLEPENQNYRWLSAAAWDRIMMRLGKPQWYGTQFTKPKATGVWQLYQMDETAVTDDERRAMNVPSLAEAKARVAKLNAENQGSAK